MLAYNAHEVAMQLLKDAQHLWYDTPSTETLAAALQRAYDAGREAARTEAKAGK